MPPDQATLEATIGSCIDESVSPTLGHRRSTFLANMPRLQRCFALLVRLPTPSSRAATILRLRRFSILAAAMCERGARSEAIKVYRHLVNAARTAAAQYDTILSDPHHLYRWLEAFEEALDEEMCEEKQAVLREQHTIWLTHVYPLEQRIPMTHAAHGGPLEVLADILKSQGKNAEVVSVLREYLGLLESFDAVAWPVQDDRMHSLGLHQDRPRHLARVAVSLAEAISRVDDPSWPEVEANMRRAMSTFSDDPSMVQGWEGQFELSDYHSLLARALEEQSKFAEGEGERRKARSLLHAASQHTQVHPSHIL